MGLINHENIRTQICRIYKEELKEYLTAMCSVFFDQDQCEESIDYTEWGCIFTYRWTQNPHQLGQLDVSLNDQCDRVQKKSQARLKLYFKQLKKNQDVDFERQGISLIKLTCHHMHHLQATLVIFPTQKA